MKKLSVVILFLVLGFVLQAQYFNVPDYSFRKFLKENHPSLMNGDQLDIEKAEDFDGVIDCSNRKIRTLSGIEHFKKLKGLNCSNNQIQNLDLDKCVKLEELDITNNRLKSVHGFKKTKKLRKLKIENNEIDEIEYIDKLKDLEDTDISKNKVGYWNHEKLEKISKSRKMTNYNYFTQNKFGSKKYKSHKHGDRVEFEVPEHGEVQKYQWYKNGKKIPGANRHKYEIESFDPSTDGGEYSCKVESNSIEELGTGEADCGECDGKAKDMTLRYTGAGGQVVVKQKDGTIVFDGYLENGQEASFTGKDKKGTLGTVIKITIDGVEDASIHTSCSVPLELGLTFGSFEIVGGSSRNGGPFCAIEGWHPHEEDGVCECDEYESEVIIVNELSCENIDLELKEEDILDRSCGGPDGSITFTISNGSSGNLYRIRKKDEFGDYKIFSSPTYVNISNEEGLAKTITIDELDAGEYDLYAYCGGSPSNYDVTVFTVGKDTTCPQTIPTADCDNIEVILDKSRIGFESAPGVKDVDVTFKIRSGSANNLYRIRKQNSDGVYIPMTAPAYINTGNAIGEEFDITIYGLGVGIYDIYAYCGDNPGNFKGEVFQIFLAPQDGAVENCEGIDMEVDQSVESGLKFKVKNGSAGNYYRLRKKDIAGGYTVLTNPGFINLGNALGQEIDIEVVDLLDGDYDVYCYCGTDPSNYKGITFNIVDEVVHNCRVSADTAAFNADEAQEETAVVEIDPEFVTYVYPNPAYEMVNIELAGLNNGEESRVRVFSGTGAMMYKETFKTADVNAQIDVSEWAKGIYYIEIRFLDRAPVHKQVVVQ